MLRSVHPKLPMRNKEASSHYYVSVLGFTLLADYGNYLILEKDHIEIHFFLFEDLVPEENYGQIYIRVENIEAFYSNCSGIRIHRPLEAKPWGQREFSLLDPDNNLLTFGEEI